MSLSLKVTEATIQAVIMRWALEAHHEYAIPGSNTFLNYSWEADVISVTKAGLSHEYEIKLTAADYRRDCKKHKFAWGVNKCVTHSPSYFWYVTYDFLIEPPDFAGWMHVTYNNKKRFVVEVVKNAPRLNNWKLPEEKAKVAARLLSWRLMNLMEKQALQTITMPMPESIEKVE